MILYILQVKNAKPGVLSEELRNGLGMAEGAPPPWLINMQRYGPPPSYPELKVAPIPPATSNCGTVAVAMEVPSCHCQLTFIHCCCEV